MQTFAHLTGKKLSHERKEILLGLGLWMRAWKVLAILGSKTLLGDIRQIPGCNAESYYLTIKIVACYTVGLETSLGNGNFNLG